MDDFEVRRGAVEERIAYRFRDAGLLAQALTHSSGKSDTAPSNERLEFLGDSILGAVVARHLYLSHPSWDEGELTRVKSAVVSASSLAEVSRSLGLSQLCVVGKGMSKEARYPTSILANLVEALVAAIYIDGGFDAAERFVIAQLSDRMQSAASEEGHKNWKSILQQYAQKRWSVTPTYRVTREVGPEHVKRFEVVARLGERGEAGYGEGRSKKEAEQCAAESTLRSILGDRVDSAREQDIEKLGEAEVPGPAPEADSPPPAPPEGPG